MNTVYIPRLSEAVKDRGAARREKYTVQTVARLPMMWELPSSGPAFIGTFSVTQAPARWLLDTAAVDVYGFDQSPTEITRDYLTVKFPKKLRRKAAQIEACKLHRPAPQLAVPGYYPDYAYVDLRAAYWSIVRGLGWNVDYWPMMWLARGDEMDDFPLAGNKPARNYLVSVGVSEGMQIWTGGKLKTKPGNNLANHGLYALVQDTLHALAWMAREYFSAVYVNVDGYIVPAAQADQLIAAVGEWGIGARVKHEGAALIRGAGNYDIGIRRSRLPRWSHTRFHDNIIEEPARWHWLKPRFAKLCRP